MAAVEQLSGTIVVIIIAIGAQLLIMFFIWIKRQIVRIALRNKRGPHTHLGQGAPKPLRREIDRCLDFIPLIKHEPKVCVPERRGGGGESIEHIHRLRALACYGEFEAEICSNFGSVSSSFASRPAATNVRSFLLKCFVQGHGQVKGVPPTPAPLHGVDPHDIQLACDLYEHAKHHYKLFGEKELRAFQELIGEFRKVLIRNSRDHNKHKQRQQQQQSRTSSKELEKVSSTTSPKTLSPVSVVKYTPAGITFTEPENA